VCVCVCVCLCVCVCVCVCRNNKIMKVYCYEKWKEMCIMKSALMSPGHKATDTTCDCIRFDLTHHTPRFEKEDVAPLSQETEDLLPGRLSRLLGWDASEHTTSCTTRTACTWTSISGTSTTTRRRPARNANDGGLRPLLAAGLLRVLLPRGRGGAVAAGSDPCRSRHRGK